jgi:hypothetical protein
MRISMGSQPEAGKAPLAGRCVLVTHLPDWMLYTCTPWSMSESRRFAPAATSKLVSSGCPPVWSGWYEVTLAEVGT